MRSGWGRIMVETVGVGQTELEITGAADTVVVVLVPESGDGIQAMKAGLMEIADVFVVNKADRPGADRLMKDIRVALHLRAGKALSDVPAHHGVDLSRVGVEREAAPEAKDEVASWEIPVLKTVAQTEEGVTELLAAIDEHGAFLRESGELRARRRARAAVRIREVANRELRGILWAGRASALSSRRASTGSRPERRPPIPCLRPSCTICWGPSGSHRSGHFGRKCVTSGMSTLERDMTSPGELMETVAEQKAEIEQLREQLKAWEEEFGATPTRDVPFTTLSGVDVQPLYTPLDREGAEGYEDALGVPGQFPFTRGPYATMYRTCLWTMRQFAGFATARRDERAVQVPAGAWHNRAVGGVRFPHPHGLRQRSPSLSR